MMVTPILKVGKHTMTCSGDRVREGMRTGPTPEPELLPTTGAGVAVAIRHTVWRRTGWLEGPATLHPGKLQLLPRPFPTPSPALTSPPLPRNPENGWCGHARYASDHDTGSQKDLESSHVALNKGLWSQPQCPPL